MQIYKFTHYCMHKKSLQILSSTSSWLYKMGPDFLDTHDYVIKDAIKRLEDICFHRNCLRTPHALLTLYILSHTLFFTFLDFQGLMSQGYDCGFIILNE